MKSYFLYAITILSILTSSCVKENEDDITNEDIKVEIKNITTSKKTLSYKQTTTISLDLGSTNLNNIEVEWLSSNGNSFTDTNKDHATWKAPSEQGTYEIAVNITKNNITTFHKITDITVIGAFIDEFKSLVPNNVWAFSSDTSYALKNSSIELVPKPLKNYSYARVTLSKIFGSTNKFPQSANSKIKIDKTTFSSEDDFFRIGYICNTTNNTTGKYINLIYLTIRPNTNTFYSTYSIIDKSNPDTTSNQSFLSSSLKNIPNNSLKDNEFNDVGINIDENLIVKAYLNKQEIFSAQIGTNTEIKTTNNPIYFYVINNKKITLSKFSLDNTDQSLYNFDTLNSF